MSIVTPKLDPPIVYHEGDWLNVPPLPIYTEPELEAFLAHERRRPPLLFPTPVHPLESTARSGYVSPAYLDRHAPWANRRRRVYDALVATCASESRIARFASCGAGFWVLRRRDDHRSIKIVRDSCHDRFCEACGQARQFTIRRNLRNKIAPHPHRFLTLTLKNDGIALPTLLDKLLRCFKRLRSTVFWREKVRGGAAFIELSANPENGRWHPHLHVLLDGKYLDQRALRDLWLKITGDSFVLDIRLIRDTGQVADYITKYATKPLPAKVVDKPYLLEEAIQALQGRKLCYTFGTWSRWALLRAETDDEWETLCHANEIPFRILRPGDYNSLIHQAITTMIDHDGPIAFTVDAIDTRDAPTTFDRS